MSTFVNGVDTGLRLVIEGPGVKFRLPPVSIVGTGSDILKVIPLPSVIRPRNGEKFRLGGTIYARNSGVIVCTVEISGMIVKKETSSWTLLQSGEARLYPRSGCGTYFTKAGSDYTPEELPGLYDNAGVLSVVAKPIASAVVTLEYQGTIASGRFDS